LDASASKEPASLSGVFREKTSTSTAVDVAELDVLYRDLPPYQPEVAGDVTAVEEMRAALPSTEPIAFLSKSVGEMTVVSLMPPVSVTAGLRVITSLTSLTLIVEPALSGVVTNPTSVVAGILVSMKTPPRLPAIPRPSPTSVFATSSTVMMMKLVKVLSSEIIHSPGVIEAEKEFMAEMVNSFYKSLKWTIALILKGSTVSFAALKAVLKNT